LETIVAPDKTYIILIQTKVVTLHNHALGGAHGHAWTATPLEAHACLWTALFTHFTWLDAATPPKHSLAATVIAPPTPWLDVV
jgi:hypothetical protein